MQANEIALQIHKIGIAINEIDDHAPVLHPRAAPWDLATRKNPFRPKAAERYLSTLSKTLSRRYLSSLTEMFPLKALPDDFPVSFPGFQPMASLQKPIPPASPDCPFLPSIASCLGGSIWIICAFPEKGIGATHFIHHLHCRY